MPQLAKTYLPSGLYIATPARHVLTNGRIIIFSVGEEAKEVQMFRLMVRCPETKVTSFTGLLMDAASLSHCDFVFDHKPHDCPFCGERHSYLSADFFLEAQPQAGMDLAAE